MNHLSEEQLILHYYGEEGDTLAVEQHLEGCEECRGIYVSLQRVLNVVDTLPVPSRPAEYGAQVWQRLEAQMPRSLRPKWWQAGNWRWAAATVAFASLMTGAFLAGRHYQQPRAGTQLAGAKSKSDPASSQRILLVAVGDYLERSQMVLIELANASPKGPLDITSEKERAEDLVSESRFYRQTAAHTGDTQIASVLDDLDRVLLEIAHSPSELSPDSLETLRHRLEAEGILFKIRVLGSSVRNQEAPRADDHSKTRQTL